jgi:hypothetical protein
MSNNDCGSGIAGTWELDIEVTGVVEDSAATVAKDQQPKRLESS